MRTVLLAAVLFALSATSTVAQQEPPVPPITTNGWGRVRIGMALDEAADSLLAKF